MTARLLHAIKQRHAYLSAAKGLRDIIVQL